MMLNDTAIKQELKEFSQRSERVLDRWLPPESRSPMTLHKAMRYAVFNGGKRVRPILTYATGLALDLPLDSIDGPACAVELIHDYSLIHDDLPAMDDDDLRRGKPTCHRAFDEATAILAGDALQALAFQVLAEDASMIADPSARLRIVSALSTASGSLGMAGGQMIDLEAVGKAPNLQDLENMHLHKTGALIRSSVVMAALSKPGVSDAEVARLDHFAKCLGLAFQIHDDVLDVEQSTETLGKTQGADMARNKPTFPALIGLRESKARAKALCEEALACLDEYGERAAFLRNVARYIVDRIH